MLGLCQQSCLTCLVAPHAVGSSVSVVPKSHHWKATAPFIFNGCQIQLQPTAYTANIRPMDITGLVCGYIHAIQLSSLVVSVGDYLTD